MFLGRLITEPNMFAVVKGLFRSRAASFFEADFTPIGVLPSILINMIYSTIFSRGF